MFEVLVVDDEPAVGRYLTSLINTRCEGFSVVVLAGDGRQALDIVRSQAINLVLTDIKMPVMDGLELIGILKQEYPNLPVVIVSGYQEFEYARKALDTGVVDYLIKPVTLARLQKILHSLRPSLQKLAAGRISELLNRIVHRADPGDAVPTDLGKLYVAVYRSHGLPPRFNRLGFSFKPEYCSRFHRIPGRDCHEQVCIGVQTELSWHEFLDTIDAYIQNDPVESSVLLFSKQAVPLGDLAITLSGMFEDVDRMIIPASRLRHVGELPPAQSTAWDPLTAHLLDCVADSHLAEALPSAVASIVARWKDRHLSLLLIEADLRACLQYLARKRNLSLVSSEIERELDAAMADARTYEHLAESATGLFTSILSPDRKREGCADVPVLFAEIRAWMTEHFDQAVSLSSAARQFRVSPSYVGKLFRKYADTSFGDMLTARRIETAKMLIEQAPDMPFKDIAERVGFQDPFYFSRVFKNFEGIPPREYAVKLQTGHSLPPSSVSDDHGG
jgi:two-component system, response regulator YesN